MSSKGIMIYDTKIKCPDCGCTPHNGFDVVDGKDHIETSDAQIKTLYHCPKCNENFVRVYKFTKWERERGES